MSRHSVDFEFIEKIVLKFHEEYLGFMLADLTIEDRLNSLVSFAKGIGYQLTLISFDDFHDLKPESSEYIDNLSEASLLTVSENEGTKHFVLYDQHVYKKRVMFSICHELGHLVLNHNTSRKLLNESIKEKEANIFASRLLLPSFLIDKLSDTHYFNEEQFKSMISDVFGVSLSATEIAINHKELDYYYIKFTNNEESNVILNYYSLRCTKWLFDKGYETENKISFKYRYNWTLNYFIQYFGPSFEADDLNRYIF